MACWRDGPMTIARKWRSGDYLIPLAPGEFCLAAGLADLLHSCRRGVATDAARRTNSFDAVCHLRSCATVAIARIYINEPLAALPEICFSANGVAIGECVDSCLPEEICAEMMARASC